jgi:hypothetical protein
MGSGGRSIKIYIYMGGLGVGCIVSVACMVSTPVWTRGKWNMCSTPLLDPPQRHCVDFHKTTVADPQDRYKIDMPIYTRRDNKRKTKKKQRERETIDL